MIIVDAVLHGSCQVLDDLVGNGATVYYCHTKNRLPMCDVDFTAKLASLRLACHEVGCRNGRNGRGPTALRVHKRDGACSRLRNTNMRLARCLCGYMRHVPWRLALPQVREAGAISPPPSPPAFESLFPEMRMMVGRAARHAVEARAERAACTRPHSFLHSTCDRRHLVAADPRCQARGAKSLGGGMLWQDGISAARL